MFTLTNQYLINNYVDVVIYISVYIRSLRDNGFVVYKIRVVDRQLRTNVRKVATERREVAIADVRVVDIVQAKQRHLAPAAW